MNESIQAQMSLQSARASLTTGVSGSAISSRYSIPDPLDDIKESFEKQYNCNFDEFVAAVLADHPELQI
jgi:hypothetical protein